MKGEKRRKQLLNILSSSNNPVSGGTLSPNIISKENNVTLITEKEMEIIQSNMHSHAARRTACAMRRRRCAKP